MSWIVDEIPIVHVHQNCHRLTKNQWQPNDDIPRTTSSQELVSKETQRNLSKHAIKSPKSEHVQWYWNQIFVEKCRYKEYNSGGSQFRVSIVNNRLVHMSNCPTMHWNVPRAPEISDRLRIPKVQIKFTISKTQNFGQKIESRMEHRVKSKKPEQMIRNGEFEKSSTQRLRSISENGAIEFLTKGMTHCWLNATIMNENEMSSMIRLIMNPLRRAGVLVKRSS